MQQSLRNLPIDERIQLVEDLWDSIAADQQVLPLTDSQKDVLESRLAAYEADGNKGVPAAEAIAEVKSRL